MPEIRKNSALLWLIWIDKKSAICLIPRKHLTTFIINFCKCMINIFLKWKLRKDIQIESPGCQKHCVILSSLKINFILCTKKTPSVKNEITYKNYKNTLNKLLKRAEKQHYHDLLIKHKDNRRKSWSVIKSIIQKNKRSTCQSKFKLSDGTISDDKQLISTKYNDFFVNIGPTLASKIPNVDKSPLFFMCNKIDKLILSLKDSAPGWDDITATLLKVSLDYIRDPLCHLCNKSLQSGIFPAQLKIANVLPLYKAQDPFQFNNYRPVSLLCILSKVFEKIMYSRLNEYLVELGILYEFQFGFRKKHSTHLALLILLDKLTKALDDGKKAIGIFLDFSKAFDTVNHDILLDKLFHYGIRGPAYKWFQSYLSDRSQYVTYNGVKSPTKQIKCGVPQGSILGPLLFLIYINDLPNVCKVMMPFLFADDTHLFTSGDNIEEMYEVANQELISIAEWLKVNKLSLNVKKTHYMVFSGANSVPPLIRPNKLKIEGEEISEVSKTKFLGVIIDNKLKWQHHIMYISSKISKGLGVILKARKFLNTDSLKNLYYAFVYSYLLYCNHVWGNASMCYLNKLIVLQKKAIRIIAGVSPRTSTYHLFQELDVLNLQQLNLYLIVRLMYKVYFGDMIHVFRNMFVVNQSIRPQVTRQSSHYHTPLYCKNIGQTSIRYMGTIIWNNVLKSSVSLNQSEMSFVKEVKTHIIAGSINDKLL